MKPARYVFAVILTVHAAAGLSRSAWPQSDESSLTKITVAQVGEFFLYMPVYIADGKGFLQSEHLAVSIINTGGDDKSVTAIITGAADFGVGDPTFAAIAGLRGQNVKAIASVVNGVPFWGLTKKPNVPVITNPSQLLGLSVATFPAPSTAYTLQARMFRLGGLKPNIRQVQFGTLLPLLDSGVVDIVLELEPNVSTAVQQGARIVYSMAQANPEFAITGVTVMEGTIKRRRDVVERFVRALDKAEKYAHQDPQGAITYAKSRFPSLEPTIVENAMHRTLEEGTFPRNAVIADAAWKAAIDLRVEAGEIPSVQDAMPFLDNSIAKNVQ